MSLNMYEQFFLSWMLLMLNINITVLLIFNVIK